MSSTYYQIEKGIPIPPPIPTSPVRSALARLSIGDSFLARSGQRAQISRISSELGIKVAVRTVKEGVRVWRVKR